jgi:hypothetical protein
MMRKTTIIFTSLILAMLFISCSKKENKKENSKNYKKTDKIIKSKSTKKENPCGNSKIDKNEECDLNNLNGKTCGKLNFCKGKLSCLKTCKFDTSSCISKEKCNSKPVKLKVEDKGYNFINEGKMLYRVLACGKGEIPEGFDKGVVNRHCKDLNYFIRLFKKKFINKLQPFTEKLIPKNLPKTVVYPFGGGDLVTALAVYPSATEFTTISLEHPGDPTKLKNLDFKELSNSLVIFREVIKGLLTNNDSASVKIRKLDKGKIPGQLSFFLTGLRILNYELLSLKYFKFNSDGSIHYYTKEEIKKLAKVKAKKHKKSWLNPDFSTVFSKMEIKFRKIDDKNAPIKIHRHIAANLNNEKFKDSPLYKHLYKKGKISAITKAASYLLWWDGFSEIRKYLTSNMKFMISDSTGIPPSIAKKTGFEQITYGSFAGAYLKANKKVNEEFIELWKKQKYRRLRFRFGYPDIKQKFHLLITKPIDG